KCEISEDQIQIISSGLEKCQNIRYLNLNISSQSIMPFQDFDGSNGNPCFNYNWYYISCFKISCSISNILLKIPNLTELELDLSYNEFCSDGLMPIMSALQNCKKITKLNLNLQKLFFHEYIKPELQALGTGELILIGKTLKQLTQITQLRLNLSFNNIRCKQFIAIVSALNEFKSFDTLNLNFSNNQIGNEGIQEIRYMLGKKDIGYLELDLRYYLFTKTFIFC
ncbi:hypothetical protein ABPG74_006648, partial [Tetrahymena malaccensis]